MQSLQLKPNEKIIIPLDKVFRNVFNPSKTAKVRHIIEDKLSGVKTVITFESFKGSLNQFDKLIFCAAVSEWRAGNEIFTVRRLWQKIGGSHYLNDEMRMQITDSVEKLACTRVTIDMTEINDKLHYSEESSGAVFKNYLLPCILAEKKINGQVVASAFKLLDESPLFTATRIKKQFTEHALELLDMPNLRNTESVLKLKFYLLERVTAIIGSHRKHKAHIVGKTSDGKPRFKRATKLQKIITFEDIFEQCELSGAEKNRKAEYRKVIEKILDHLKDKGLISEWTFTKQGGKFHSINFDFK